METPKKTNHARIQNNLKSLSSRTPSHRRTRLRNLSRNENIHLIPKYLKTDIFYYNHLVLRFLRISWSKYGNRI